MDYVDYRWPIIQYILRDLVRAIDPTPGLAVTLTSLEKIADNLKEGKRVRKRQAKIMRELLS